jgi:hypothetical protein
MVVVAQVGGASLANGILGFIIEVMKGAIPSN